MQSRFVRLKELCTARMGYSFRHKPDCIADGKVLLIQPKDVTTDGILDEHDLCRTDLPVEKRLRTGDVLMINRGRFTACVFNGAIKEPCVATSAFLIFTPKDPSQLLPEYLALFFNSAEGQNLFKRLTMTTTIPFISLGHLASIEIPLPSIERQKALATFGELNTAYLRLSSRKAELQKQIVWAGLVSAHVRAGLVSAHVRAGLVSAPKRSTTHVRSQKILPGASQQDPLERCGLVARHRGRRRL